MEVSIFPWCKIVSRAYTKFDRLAAVGAAALSVPRMRMGVYYGFMQPSYLWHFQEPRKTAELLTAFLPARARTLEEGERYIQHFSYRPPLQSFFFLNLKSSPRFHLFCFVCVFLLWSLFLQPQGPTNLTIRKHQRFPRSDMAKLGR